MARQYSSKSSTKSIIIKTLKRPIKKALSKFSKNNVDFRKKYLKLKRKRRSIIFNNAAKQPIEEKTVIFESFMGRKYADSPKAIYEYMVNSEEYKDYKFIWFFRERCVEEYLYLEKNGRTSLMLWGSPEYYKNYATAKYWITNSRMPLAIVPREEQVYVQCWHGTPLKRLGFDVEVEANDARNNAKEVMEIYESDARRYKYMVSPSSFCTEKFKSAFNLEAIGKGDIIIEEGYPRNDEIVNHTTEKVEEIKKKLGIAPDKKVVLYAPTWRENQHVRGVGYTYEAPIDFKQMNEKLGDDYVVLFRAHYFIANAFDFGEYEGFVYDVCEYPDINDLYIISDVLITDYSSVFFDYGILKRPVVFYMYDLKYYKDELRGFYIDLSELPGPIVETQEDLEDKLANVEVWSASPEYQKKYEEFTNKFTYLDDGHATERVVKAIFGK